MPDDRVFSTTDRTVRSLKTIAPPLLMALGAVSLLRNPRLLMLIALGGLLYDAATEMDAGRKSRGRTLAARRALGLRLDAEIEDTFPASDPPSSSGGITAGSPA